MRRILVTGANKGIGFAIVERILEHADDTFVFLGSRDRTRGEAAVKSLVEADTSLENRVQVLEIDVASNLSVDQASRAVQNICKNDALYGIVNNAGIGLGSGDLSDVFNVNTRGIQRVCSAFIPLLGDSGRIVNVTSAAGPNFVAKCSAEYQRFFTNPDITREEIDALMNECTEYAGDTQAFSSRGLSDGAPYGLSKACANAYTVYLARQFPQFVINACTPGLIATDLTRQFEQGRGSRAGNMNMKTPREGATSALFLLFDKPDGTGHYYGSDARRSPLDRYRAPGSPPYSGD